MEEEPERWLEMALNNAIYPVRVEAMRLRYLISLTFHLAPSTWDDPRVIGVLVALVEAKSSIHCDLFIGVTEGESRMLP